MKKIFTSIVLLAFLLLSINCIAKDEETTYATFRYPAKWGKVVSTMINNARDSCNVTVTFSNGYIAFYMLAVSDWVCPNIYKKPTKVWRTKPVKDFDKYWSY